MNTLIQHAKLAIRMNNNGINREFIKKFPIEEIIDCCNRIEQNKILNDEYNGETLIVKRNGRILDGEEVLIVQKLQQR